MGYETKYNLTIEGDYDYEKMLDIFNYYDIINYALDNNFDYYSSCKWYDHEEHLIEISKKFPNNVFILEGNGEESPDFWKKKFINGKFKKAKGYITYEEYK